MRTTRRLRFAGGLLSVLLLTSAVATADPITVVNTGPGTSETNWDLFNRTSLYQWLAAEFSVASLVTVTSAEAWMNTYKSGDLRVRLYSDGGEVPGSPLFTSIVTLGSQEFGWRGALGLNWSLAPATYWIAFEVPSGGVGASVQGGAPSPLLNEAFAYYDPPDYNGNWAGYDSLNIGVRILGESGDTPPPAVPEPASLLLFGTGLVGLRAWRKRQR